jgi:dephospho-CoA kinase
MTGPRRVLVTGMSGTGKSAVLGELARRGHRVLDTDDPGWIVPVESPDGPEPVWDLDRVTALLDGHRSGWLFVAGCVANQGQVHDRFDAVVLLSAPLDVVLSRVRQRENPYGSTAEDRDRIADDLASVEPRLRAGADAEVVSTVPVPDVADALERIAATGRAQL